MENRARVGIQEHEWAAGDFEPLLPRLQELQLESRDLYTLAYNYAQRMRAYGFEVEQNIVHFTTSLSNIVAYVDDAITKMNEVNETRKRRAALLVDLTGISHSEAEIMVATGIVKVSTRHYTEMLEAMKGGEVDAD